MRVNHEYGRGGAMAYLAAYNVHQGKAIGRCEPTTGIVPFMALVEQVMTQEPCASACDASPRAPNPGQFLWLL
ncbi:hypothetical protein ABZ461_38440 [Actinacidiphila glaucinigra]|uniref:hypothetical protein n=1 Tax=Actinacidiphila glaucinigra TaxID=235986 RepID=UPI00340B7DFE